MPRLLILGLAASALLVSVKAAAQADVSTAVATSETLMDGFEFQEARDVVLQELKRNPSDGERDLLMGQLEKIGEATPYYMHLDLSSSYVSGTRHGLWEDRLL